jgi:hypothetical protein
MRRKLLIGFRTDAAGGVASMKAARIALRPMFCRHRADTSGATSLRAIAKALNARGVATARGGVWTPVQVTAVMRRAA